MSENDLPVAPVHAFDHTPGPWAARRGEHGWGIEYSSRHGICTIHDNTDGSRRDEQAANAQLIAAAPDLLQACKAALAAIRSACQDGSIIWLDPPFVLPGVHESAAERLQNVIEQAESVV